MAKRKILILAANPKNSSLRRLDREVRDIEAGMKRSKLREEFEIVTQLALRTGDIQRALLDEEPAIVHFAGQGAGANGLIFEDNNGKAKLVSTQALARLFKLFKNKVECVVLNACYSEEQAEALREHIGHVVGVEDEITNRQAIQFATGFYDALGAGRSYEDASEMGRIAVDISAPAISKTQRNLRTAMAISVGIAVTTVISRFSGVLMPSELAAYDLFMNLSRRFTGTTSSSITLVTISDKERDSWGKPEVSDFKVWKILDAINKVNPKLIGLDIFRDIPQKDIQREEEFRQKGKVYDENEDYNKLIDYLKDKNNNIVSTCESSSGTDVGSPPPFEIQGPETIIGFSDIVKDGFRDSVRRQILWMDVDAADCSINNSLSYRIALNYLESEYDIKEERDDIDSDITLGETAFPLILPGTGGYTRNPDKSDESDIDFTGGDQILVNYSVKGFETVSAEEIWKSIEDESELTTETQKKIRDKIVLFGYTEKNVVNDDRHQTPIGEIWGVQLQAHMINNILAPIEDDQPIIKAFEPEGDSLLIIFWCCLGGNLIWIFKSRQFIIIIGLTVTGLLFISYLLAFTIGGLWLPLVPSIGGWLLSIISLIVVDTYRVQKEE